MNHTEGNKLIAEFMGYTWHPNNTLNGIKGVLRHETKASMHLDESKQFHAKYHKSWDWLMPVVEKIESLGYCFQIERLINGEHRTYILRLNTFEPILYGNRDSSKLLCVYNTVLEFINWYNEQKIK